MKIGVIGCGNIANSFHIPCYLENDKAEIKYFCDIIPERAENAVKMVPRKLSGMKARLFANIFIFTYSSYSKGSKTVSGKRPLPYIPFFHLFYHFAAKLQSCDLHFGLSLQCADHDALYKVLLQKRINTQNRKCCHDNNRIFDTLRNAVRFCNAGILRHV